MLKAGRVGAVGRFERGMLGKKKNTPEGTRVAENKHFAEAS